MRARVLKWLFLVNKSNRTLVLWGIMTASLLYAGGMTLHSQAGNALP